MKVIRQSEALQKALARYRKKKIGFVPTMGYLHEGHLSLMRMAKKENDLVVASIFVNPLQFGPREDLDRYPRDLKRDQMLLTRVKIDFLFVPSEKDFYSTDFQTRLHVKELAKPLCGKTRPIHFAGVATVVLKLLNLVRPTSLYLGQKDYQQFRVVEQMVRDLDVPVHVRMAPIVRERDGLAMSSRNVFLSAEERKEAAYLNRGLKAAATLAARGEQKVSVLRKAILSELKKAPHGALDYAEIVDAVTLAPVVNLKFGRKALAALAVYFSRTRLIDNILIRG